MKKALLTLLTAAGPLTAKTVSSLDQVGGAIASTEIRREYDYQIGNSDEKADGFGYLPRDGAQTAELLKLLAPSAKIANVGLVSLKAWRDGQSIAVVCENLEPIAMRENQHFSNECREQYAKKGVNPLAKITVAVLTQDRNGKFQLAAAPYVEEFKYEEQDKDGDTIREPSDDLAGKQFTLRNHSDDLVVGELDRLDFAPYQLSENHPAFGVRYLAQVMYSGGGAFNQAITLFTVMDGQLRPVLTAPTYEFADIAGEWHQDGTRDHDVSSREFVLILKTSGQDDFRDIIWRERGAKKSEGKTYRWDSRSQSYR